MRGVRGTQSASQVRVMSRTARVLVHVLPVCAALAAGCGTSASSNDAGGTAGAGGSAGSGGAAGDGSGRGGASGGISGGGGATGGGGGGSVVASCPGAAPADGQACTGAGSCFYEDCAGSGRTVATCAKGAWAVETGACTGVFCLSRTCAIGQICIMSAGGALLVDCVPNTCGNAAIECGCLQSCTAACSVAGSLQSGVTIRCNTCASNQCA